MTEPWVTVRDTIAMEAMKSLLANPHPGVVSQYREIAGMAYAAADAMMAEREKPRPEPKP